MAARITARSIGAWVLVGALALLAAQVSGCGCGAIKPAGHMDSGDGGPEADGDDATTDVPTDPPADTAGDPGADDPVGDCACGDGEVCRYGECVEDHGPCAVADDCSDDTCCSAGACVPFGTTACGDTDPECTQLVIAGLFQPSLQCEWAGPAAGDPFPDHLQVLGTPVVADLDLDGDPATVHPSIVFNSYDGLDGDSGVATTLDGVLRIVDGRTCAPQYSIGPYTNGCNTPAIGDVDVDGRPDIVLYMNDSALEAYSFDAAAGAFVRIWETHDAGGTRNAATRLHMWTGPSLADLDGDGRPETLADGTVYDSAGLLVDASQGGTSYFSVVADLDVDGVVELATGAGIFGWSGGAWASEAGGWVTGYVAVADFGTFPDDGSPDVRVALDGTAEIAVVHAGQVAVHTVGGRIVLGPIGLPASTGGGPPTVGDFDGDGLAELAAAGSDSYTIFDPDCTGAPDPALCGTGRSDGILWTRPSQDHSSNITGSSIFDFEGDGVAEAVYADECFVRVYDGRTGDVVYSQYRSSCTWNENPIVADVDGDLNAELVVPSNRNCGTSPSTMGGTAYDVDALGRILDPLFPGTRCATGAECGSGTCSAGLCRCTADADCTGGSGLGGFVCATPPAGTPGTGDTCRAAWLGGVNGVRVYEDALDRWAGSRIIWNQHAYAVTHVGEDGTVPATGAWVQNWTDPDLNNFRQNVQGGLSADHVPDMTSDGAGGVTCVEGTATITVMVCNRGTAPVGAWIPVTFWIGDPASCVPVPGCTVLTPAMIDPGNCVEVSCEWVDAPTEPTDVTVVADDDGTCGGVGGERECHEGNNGTVIAGVECTGPM